MKFWLDKPIALVISQEKKIKAGITTLLCTSKMLCNLSTTDYLLLCRVVVCGDSDMTIKFMTRDCKVNKYKLAEPVKKFKE